jgi:hypothetical protein
MTKTHKRERVTRAEFFGLIDREIEIDELLQDKFPEIEYADYLRTLASYIDYARSNANVAVLKLAAMFAQRSFNPDAKRTRGWYDRAQFYLFALASTPQVIYDFLDKNTPPLFDHLQISSAVAALRKRMYGGIQEWKGNPATLLMMALRHHAQHGHMFVGQIDVQVRTSHHAKGAGFSGEIGLSEPTWERVIRDISNANQKAKARAFYEVELKGARDELDPHPKSKRRIGLSRAIEAYEAACDSLFKQLAHETGAMSALKKRDILDLRKELATIARRIADVEVGDE